MTIIGTRPELIRLSIIIKKLDKICKHIVIYTGQNFNPDLSDIFFQDLKIRKPDHSFNIGKKHQEFASQVGQILVSVEKLLLVHKPDKVLILGDTNSGLSAIVAKRMGIPVYHMEAGNRCYDDRVPEEVNRRIIDQSSTILMPYTKRSKDNLLKEGFATGQIYVIGNPINEVINYYQGEIDKSPVMKQFSLDQNGYFLITLHRKENIDEKNNLFQLNVLFKNLIKKFNKRIIFSVHPHTQSKLNRYKISLSSNNKIQLCKPFGFFDFIKLEKNAFCVLSDSGTVGEECCILRIPNIILREVTERPETLECGSNLLNAISSTEIVKNIELMTSRQRNWNIPSEYLSKTVSDSVINILLSRNYQDKHHG